MSNFKSVARVYNLLEKGTWTDSIGQPHQSFGSPDNSLNVIGNGNLLEFNQLINKLYESDSSIHQSYSQKTFLNRLIGGKKNSELEIEELEVKDFFTNLKLEQLVDYKIYREMYGIVLQKGLSISFGNFKILPFELIKSEEFEGVDERDIELMFLTANPVYLISYKVKSRDKDRALELADEAFEKFVLFLRYVIGTSSDKFEVGILEFSGCRSREAFVISDKGSSKTVSRYGYREPVPLDDSYFVDVESGYDKIWELIDKPKATKLEKRLTTAVEWLGRSLTERSIQAAFIEASIELESLFTHNEKSIISPSILSQISESTALILGDSYDTRIEIERHIKKLLRGRNVNLTLLFFHSKIYVKVLSLV